MAGSLASSRPAPERKPVIQTTTTPERKAVSRASTASPTKTTRPSSVGPRPTKKSSTSSLRAAGVGDTKRRLSTIPASPTNRHAVRPGNEKGNDFKLIPENPKGKGLIRPPLGTRQSTRSAAILQRIQEYELVNVMLRAAMAAEDAGDEEQKENLTTEVDDAITHLKASLDVTEVASTAEKSVMLHESTESVSILEGQLQESKATIQTLAQELEELRSQMTESARSAHPGAGDAHNAAELISAAHSAEFEELKKQHELEELSLREKIRELELSKQEIAVQSRKEMEDAKKTATEAGDTKTTQLLNDQQSLHTKVVEALKSDIALDQKSIREYADKVMQLERETEEYKKTIGTQQDQLAKQDRDLQGQGSVIESLQNEVSVLRQANKTEAEALKQSSANQVAELQSNIAALKSAMAQSSEQSAISGEHNHEELVRKEQEISKLRAVVERLQDEVQSVHESRSNELEKKLLQIGQEHDQFIMALKAEHQVGIERLAKSHHNVVEKLADEAQNNRTANEKQIQELERTTNLLKVSQEKSEKRMQELELRHNEALRAADENLLNAEKALADSQQSLERTREDSQRITVTTIKTLEERIQALEEQSGKDLAALSSSRGDLEAAQKQVETLEQVLNTIQRDSHNKEEHHTGSLRKAIAEAEAATEALSVKAAHLASAERSHAKAIEDIRSGHEADLERVRDDLTQKHDRAVQELKVKHGELLATHSNIEKSQNNRLEEIKTQHERALADSARKIADLQHVHMNDLQEVKRQAGDDHLAALRQLEEKSSERAADSEKSHTAALKSLQLAHEKNLLDLREELKDSYLKSAAITKESHDAIVKDLQAQLEQQKAGLAKAQLEVQKTSEPAENPELATLRSDLLTSNASLAKAQSEASRLADSLNEMKQQLAQDQKTIKALENATREAKEAADRSNGEVHALRNQLDGALQEAETQRASSDIANKEFRASTERLRQFEARNEELEATLQAFNEKPDLDPKVSTPNGTRRRKGNKGSKNSPRLSQNKRISEHGDEEMNGNASARMEGMNLGSSIQGTVGALSYLLPFFVMKSELICRISQMASIREQLRQLDEVNEDMLEGHAR